mmetsp:Transcript_30231/g.50050  ORF Transcript_30231/g.50050 Transcript_30231/m.50050 type:complete len:169 (-) Transcript_30231:96-602(-)|eukprot:CAMPEP_0119308552 /NCGR_PEP_ID=MMETSP1333-20130426/11533_1 /TAXON_ID=418940 /ORGANISM="Scyphosphaera apsteinii, Strain RCC1455" /LENGTH=168 /DNA_ID=CAMNT_0007312355 /DNA_START=25 /DNA_END=531 /DNA_ORIENTATION=+
MLALVLLLNALQASAWLVVPAWPQNRMILSKPVRDNRMMLERSRLPVGEVRMRESGKADKDDKMTLEKVAELGIAGILSIAVAETVFWVLSFPTSELLYYAATGEWINLLSQEGQIKFLAFTAGWGALGGVIAQYRTVLTAAAMTPWMDRNVVQPYVIPVMEKFKRNE